MQVKKTIVHKHSKSNEQNETNETIPPRMCLVGIEEGYSSFQSYTFDKFGRIKTKSINRNKDGKPETKIFLSYDERGHLIKEDSYRNKINQPDKIIRHLDTIYYKYGNLIKKSNSKG